MSTQHMNEDPRLYEIAKQITFDAGFQTWTDPRTGEVHHNPKLKGQNAKRKCKTSNTVNQNKRKS